MNECYMCLSKIVKWFEIKKELAFLRWRALRFTYFSLSL